MSNYEYIWEANESDDDFSCIVKVTMGGLGYMLRVEKMTSNVWWWCVYAPNGDMVSSSHHTDDWGRTEKEAKSLAIKNYERVHLEFIKQHQESSI